MVVAGATHQSIFADATTQNVIARTALQFILTLVAIEACHRRATKDQAIIAAATMDLYRNHHRRVKDDRVIAATGIAEDRTDAREGRRFATGCDHYLLIIGTLPDGELVILAILKVERQHTAVDGAQGIVIHNRIALGMEFQELDSEELNLGVDDRD